MADDAARLGDDAARVADDATGAADDAERVIADDSSADDASRILTGLERPRALLANPRIHRHHIMPQRFRDFFEARGIDIDQFTVELTEGRHLRSIHGRGDAITPGGWNRRWQDFIQDNPNASAREVYQHAGRLMDEFGLRDLPIVPYR